MSETATTRLPAHPVTVSPCHRVLFNRALWQRSWLDAQGLVLACAAVLVAFFALSVWMVSHVKLNKFVELLTGALPAWMQGMIPIPMSAVATYEGMLSLAYMDPVVLFTLTVYAITRGSDIVSGQLDRGTLEMLAAQPLRRITIFSAHAGVTVAGGIILAVACWLGTWTGLKVVALPQRVDAATYLPAALNLLAFTFFLTGLTSVVSSCQRYRWQTISWVGGFYIVQLIIKVVSRSSPDLNWLAHWTFFGAFEPSVLATSPEVLALSVRYDGILFGLGLLAHVLTAVIFCRRDLPAPL